MAHISFEEVKEILKKAIDETININEALEKTVQFIYSKGYEDGSRRLWIPCSERLPIEARHYLCSFNRPNRIDKIYVDLAYWTGGRWYGYGADQINAWMPLPEPYKEGQDGER